MKNYALFAKNCFFCKFQADNIALAQLRMFEIANEQGEITDYELYDIDKLVPEYLARYNPARLIYSDLH